MATRPNPPILLRALVVHPETASRRGLVRLLLSDGIASIEAADGIEALQHASRYKIDLVVTALEMPRMGGLELLELAGRGVFGSSPPLVIVCSGDLNVGRIERSPWLKRCAGVISNPLNADQLCIVLSVAFDQ